MSQVAVQVEDWHRESRPVTIVRVLATRGFSSLDRDPLAAFTADAPVAGSVLSGAIDAQLRARLAATPTLRTVLEFGVTDDEATDVGLSCGGLARLLIQPATDIDAAGWAALATGSPACLVTALASDGTVGASEVFTGATIDAGEDRYGPGVRRLYVRGVTETALLERAASAPPASATSATAAVTSFWPVPSLIVVGGGGIAAALAAAAGLLGWQTTIVDQADTATAAVTGLNQADAVVVLSHDQAVAGPALLAALAGEAGYVGGLGSARTQAARATWLTEHGVDDAAVSRIHGPAGLDIGAFTPAEIATAITAEIIAVRSGASGGSLQGRRGPIRSV